MGCALVGSDPGVLILQQIPPQGGGAMKFFIDKEWAREQIEKARVGIKIFLPRFLFLCVCLSVQSKDRVEYLACSSLY